MASNSRSNADRSSVPPASMGAAWRLGRVAACCACTLAMPALAQSYRTFEPGREYANITAAGEVIARTGTMSEVGFGHYDGKTQFMQLYAEASSVLPSDASARGRLKVDFCVPRPGQGGCDATAAADAEWIMLTVRFKYGVVGELQSGVGTSASLGTSAWLVDLQRNEQVAYVPAMPAKSISGASWFAFADVPIPMPHLDATAMNEAVSFTTQVQVGRRYRFQFSGAASAASTGGTMRAISNAGFFPMQRPPNVGQKGSLFLHDLTFQFGNAGAPLEDQVAQLQEALALLNEQVAGLGEQIEAVQASADEQVRALAATLAALTRQTAHPGTLLMREAGTAPPEGAVFLGSYRMVADAGARPRPRLTVDLYLVTAPVPSAVRPAAAARRR